jgi:uncharacterized protein
MVRGFALFGVLLVNMFNFGATFIIWTEPLDVAAFSAMRFFFETKSWRLFSMLFGFGFALQFLRAEERGVHILPTYIRRLVILFCFGMANVLLYFGDILMFYAEMGLILVLIRKMPSKTLLLLAAGLVFTFPAQRAVQTLVIGPSPEPEAIEVRLEREYARIEELSETHPYSVGTVLDVMKHHIERIPPNPLGSYQGMESTPGIFAMFMLGLYVGRRRILHEPAKHEVLIRRTCIFGIGLGFASMCVERALHFSLGYEVFRDHLIAPLPQFVGDFVFAYGGTALALGYAAGIVMLARHIRWHKLVEPLAAVGRMALSNYLMQTLMFTTLFFDYGFDQAGKLGPAAVSGYALVFFAIQVLMSNWWLKRFRYGPAEWLWRSLTYWQRQPMCL